MGRKKGVFSRKAGISYLEIALLVLSSFAFAYIIAMSEAEIASAESLNCCKMDKAGSACNNYNSNECSGLCSESCVPSLCSDSSGCEIGCCFDSVNGICTRSATKAKCESDGGIWKNSANCDISVVQECKKGCCILGDSAEFTTSRGCEKRSEERNLKIDFRAGISSELACSVLSDIQEKGACLIGNGCKFTTNQECLRLSGKSVVKNTLCTAEILNTTCKPTENTACVDGKDEVYFIDSCGNTANIYDSEKIYSKNKSYWKYSINKGNSCNFDSANINDKNCGNCNYYLGSGCGKTGAIPNFGEYSCSNLNCNDAPSAVDSEGKVVEREDRKNLESWCVYDGKVGNGDDVVGSRHFKYVCSAGEVKIEPCADFRNEICVQSETKNSRGESVFTSANCRANNWRACLDVNSDLNNVKERCEKLPDCMVKSISFADSFNFDACVPSYPEGFKISSEQKTDAEGICGTATRTCVITYKAKMMGKCECVDNCACDDAVFTEEMNDLCRKLGDCGLEANVVGKFDSGNPSYSVSNAPGLNAGVISAIVSLAKVVIGQKTDADLNRIINQFGANSVDAGDASGLGGVALASDLNLIYSEVSISQQEIINSQSGSGSVTGNVVAGITGNDVGAAAVGGGREIINIAGRYSFVKSVNVPASFGSEGYTLPAMLFDSSSGDLIAFGLRAESIASSLSSITPSVTSTAGASVASQVGGVDSALMYGLNPEAGAMNPALSEVMGTQVISEGLSGSPGFSGGTAEGFGGISSSGTSTSTSSATTAITPGLEAAMSGFFNFAMISLVIVGTAALITQLLGIQTDTTGMIAGGAAGIAAWAGASAWAGAMSGVAPVWAGGGIGGFLAGPFGLMLPSVPILIGIAVAVIVMAIFGGGLFKKCPPKKVTFTCKPWEPPVGGSECEKCNNNPLKPCSEYRCESLGTNCELINKGTTEEMCVKEKINDINFPSIIPQSLDSLGNISYEYSSISSSGFSITDNNGNCLNAYAPFFFGINTDEPAQCKYDTERKEFGEMRFDFGSSGYVYNHTGFLILPDPSHGQNQGINWTGNLSLYVKCRDLSGNIIPDFYKIDMCVKQGPDTTPPIISLFLPMNNHTLAYNKTSQAVAAITNEPAECRYSKQDKDYDLMENMMTCEDSEIASVCNSTVELSAGENNFYFRCKDQPYAENESIRNKNSESFSYKLKTSKLPLKISKVSPNRTISFGASLPKVEIELETSEGADNGKSICYYQWGGSWIAFFSTASNVHRQSMNLEAGSYIIPVKCMDIAGNTAEGEAVFSLTRDSEPPLIIRMYNLGNYVHIETNENSECAYKENYPNCGFIFENGTLMTGGFSQEHTAMWNTEKTYYIKCRDIWNNELNGCSIKLKAYNEAEQ